MTWLKRILLLAAALSSYVGCSDVEFEVRESEKCKNFSGECEVTEEGFYLFSSSIRSGKVDILFIDDNSGSMYTEQSHMADRFPDFLNVISNLDYQIAIITTDVSASPGNNIPRPANGHGAFQDGKFLPFPNGQFIINNQTSDVVNQFRQTIKRPETLVCDNNNYNPSSCPSGDERAIYAANLAFDRADANFFRSGAHLALVILADENERSNGGNITGYPLETYDLPETLVGRLESAFGPEKIMSVHSVIIRPGDTACYNAQNSQGPNIRGTYGTLFAELSDPDQDLKDLGNIVKGEMGSICASDYGQQMGDIASKIKKNSNPIQLACDPIITNGTTSLQVTFDPPPPQAIVFDVDDSNRLILDPPPPVGTLINYEYKCPRNI